MVNFLNLIIGEIFQIDVMYYRVRNCRRDESSPTDFDISPRYTYAYKPTPSTFFGFPISRLPL